MHAWVGTARGLGRSARVVGLLSGVCAAAAVLVTAAGGSLLSLAISAAAVLAALAALAVAMRQGSVESSEERATLWREGIGPRKVVDALAGEGMYRLGVEIEAPDALQRAGLVGGGHAPYLARGAVDGTLRERLRRAASADGVSLVVVSGPSKSGKSRTLCEALSATLPEKWLIEPADAASLVALAGADAPPELREGPCVIWLDDIEPFIGHGDAALNLRTMSRLARWGRPVIVVGAYGGKGQRLADPEKIVDPIADLLNAAPPLELVPWMTEQERTTLRGHPAYRTAADQIADAGIAEFMIAAPELRRRLTLDQSCPEGVAVAKAAIDWRRCGFSRPIPSEALANLCGAYLGAPASPDQFQRGLLWATRPLYSNVGLLQRRGREYEPYDYAVRIERERDRPIPVETWQATVQYCVEAEEFWWVGMEAEWHDQDGVAEAIYRAAAGRGEHGAPAALGDVLKRRGDLDGAEAAYRVGFDRGEDRAWFELGRLFEVRGQRAGADAVYLDAAKRSPGAWRSVGRHLYASCNPEGAAVVYRAAIDNGEFGAHRALATLLRECGDLDSAEIAYRDAVEHGDADARLHLGDLLRKRGHVDARAAVYRAAIEDGNRDAPRLLARMLIENGDPASAEAVYRDAVEHDDPDAWLALMRLLRERGDLDGAESVGRAAFAQGVPEAWRALGRLLQARDDWDGAAAVYRTAVARNEPLAWRALGRLLRERGDVDGAKAVYRAAAARGLRVPSEALDDHDR